jgi:hypothetical protein
LIAGMVMVLGMRLREEDDGIVGPSAAGAAGVVGVLGAAVNVLNMATVSAQKLLAVAESAGRK